MARSLIKVPTWLIYGLVVIGVAIAVNGVSLLSDHLLDNVDLRTHYQWATQFSNALAEGVIYPRWMPLANHGLGEPSFVIVHPGYYYSVAFIKALGFDLWSAMRLAAVASTIMVGIVTVWLLHGQIPNRAALVSAVLLQTLPFTAFLFGFHAALPWHFSVPLAILVIGLTIIKSSRRIDLLLSTAVALLCVTHLLVAFMVLLCLSVFHVLNVLHQGTSKLKESVIPWGCSVALGLGLSAIYWLLAATSTPLFSAETRIDDHYLNWRNSFVFPFITSTFFGIRWALIQWVMPIVPLMFLSASAWGLAAQRRIPTQLWHAACNLWIVGIIAFLLSSELAYPLYASVPLLANVQWPYRFLTVSGIAGTLAFVLIANTVLRRPDSVMIRAAIALCVVVSLALFFVLQYKQYAEGATPNLGPKTMDGYVGQRGAEPASVGPKWKKFIEGGGLDGYCDRAGIICETKLSHSTHRIWEITTDKAREIVLPLFAFPAWQVSVDDVPIATTIDKPTGLIALRIQPGTYAVSVRWSLLWQERVGLTLSSISLLIFATVFVAQRRRKTSKPPLAPLEGS